MQFHLLLKKKNIEVKQQEPIAISCNTTLKLLTTNRVDKFQHEKWVFFAKILLNDVRF